MTSPKRRNLVSLVFTCLCISVNIIWHFIPEPRKARKIPWRMHSGFIDKRIRCLMISSFSLSDLELVQVSRHSFPVANDSPSES